MPVLAARGSRGVVVLRPAAAEIEQKGEPLLWWDSTAPGWKNSEKSNLRSAPVAVNMGHGN